MRLLISKYHNLTGLAAEIHVTANRVIRAIDPNRPLLESASAVTKIFEGNSAKVFYERRKPDIYGFGHGATSYRHKSIYPGNEKNLDAEKLLYLDTVENLKSLKFDRDETNTPDYALKALLCSMQHQGALGTTYLAKVRGGLKGIQWAPLYGKYVWGVKNAGVAKRRAVEYMLMRHWGYIDETD